MALRAARVVPEIDGSPTYKEVSLRWIDAVGDLRADTSKIDGKATNAQIEAMVLHVTNPSWGSLYTVRVTDVYAGEKKKSNAVEQVHLSAQHAVVYHSKNLARVSRRAFIPSPWWGVFVSGTETPNENQGNLVDWMGAWDALWAGSFAGVSLRFTQSRDVGKKKGL